MTAPHYVVRTVSDWEWAIHDLSYTNADARHAVAYVRQRADKMVEVIWLLDIPLQAAYSSLHLVKQDLTAWAARKQ